MAVVTASSRVTSGGPGHRNARVDGVRAGDPKCRRRLAGQDACGAVLHN